MAIQYWFIRHPFGWYEKHPNIISYNKETLESSKNRNIFYSIEPNDKVVYFSYTPNEKKGIIGLFKVDSEQRENKANDEIYYKTSPLFAFDKPKSCNFKKVVGHCLKPMSGVFELKTEEYKKIKAFVLGMEEPTNEQEVVTLFAKVHPCLGFKHIKKTQQKYPDATAINSEGSPSSAIDISEDFDFVSKMIKI
jgi:hypothetical protein